MEIIAARLNNTLEKSKYNTLSSYLSAEKQERIRKFYRSEDALRSLIGDIIVRYLLCRRMKIKNQNLIFAVNEYGKPYLANYNDFQYNISHSGEWIVCCIDNCEVGIDVEEIKAIDMSIAERFFSKQEIKSLKSKNILERVDYFYDLWTLKECYTKAVGKGLSFPLDSFTIRIEEGNIAVDSMHEFGNYYFRQYNIDKNYRLAVCSRKNKFPLNIKFMDVNELYEEILQI